MIYTIAEKWKRKEINNSKTVVLVCFLFQLTNAKLKKEIAKHCLISEKFTVNNKNNTTKNNNGFMLILNDLEIWKRL